MNKNQFSNDFENLNTNCIHPLNLFNIKNIASLIFKTIKNATSPLIFTFISVTIILLLIILNISEKKSKEKCIKSLILIISWNLLVITYILLFNFLFLKMPLKTIYGFNIELFYIVLFEYSVILYIISFILMI